MTAMAGMGPPPKDPSTRRRRNKPDVAPVVLDVEPEGPPDMPEGEWAPWVHRWWASWLEAPQAKLFTGPTWRALELMVPLAQAASDGRMDAIKELRLWQAGLGALPMDQRRMGMEVREKPSTVRERPSGGAVSDLAAERRERVRRALDGAEGA